MGIISRIQMLFDLSMLLELPLLFYLQDQVFFVPYRLPSSQMIFLLPHNGQVMYYLQVEFLLPHFSDEVATLFQGSFPEMKVPSHRIHEVLYC